MSTAAATEPFSLSNSSTAFIYLVLIYAFMCLLEAPIQQMRTGLVPQSDWGRRPSAATAAAATTYPVWLNHACPGMELDCF